MGVHADAAIACPVHSGNRDAGSLIHGDHHANCNPVTSPSHTCGPAPIFKGYYGIQLNCLGAIAAALAALPTGHAAVSSLAFAWGVYCPPGSPCASPDGVLLETGYVVVTYIDGTRVLVIVHGEPNFKVVATGVGPLPTVGK
jgi:hypothetical protein